MAVTTEVEPLYISVTEAARLLGISRTHAYDQAHLGIETDGAEGLPAVRLGRRVLVNRLRLSGLSERASGGMSPASVLGDLRARSAPSPILAGDE